MTPDGLLEVLGQSPATDACEHDWQSLGENPLTGTATWLCRRCGLKERYGCVV